MTPPPARPSVPVLIEGVRLRLRRSTPADAAATFAIVSDPDVMRHLDWPAPRQADETQAYFDGCAARWQAGVEHHWMIELKQPVPPQGAQEGRGQRQPVIGSIACRIQGHAADFGYFLARAHWGRGHATEAAGLLVGWLQRQSRIVRIWATTDVRNAASAAVLRKAGLQLEGVMRKATLRPNEGPGLADRPRDTALYAWVKPDPEQA